jgi:3-phosphoinositide dependent protein kinase-1
MVTPRWEDLEFGSLLGEGAFSRVKHAKNVRTGQVFALKQIEKRQVQAQQRMKSIIRERSILASLNHEGIIRLYCAWHDESNFYFALELAEGGELATQIFRMGQCALGFSQFYTAEIVVILEYLRHRRCAHRDLKPQNLLLTLPGHLKLIDFDAAIVVPDEGDGDAAAGQGQDMEMAGTSLYVPPEVAKGTAKIREAFAVDLWALGCIIFEMLVGETPFHTSPEYGLFERLVACNYSFPQGFQHREAQSLIEGLLSEKPGARTSMGMEGIEELKQHAFFGGSVASFVELLSCRPPHRIDRVDRCMKRQWSEASSVFDFASSAELLPRSVNSSSQDFRRRFP